MKIGILTQPLSCNYGGILQNYALQQVLIKLGHTPKTIWIGKILWKDWLISCIIIIIYNILGRNYKFPITPYKKQQQERPLAKFIRANLVVTQRCRWFEKSIIKKEKFSALIVGSDQVWRPCYNMKIENSFLQFYESFCGIKIAYAASFGTDQWEYDQKQTLECSRLIKKFKAISVREESGVVLCKKYLDAAACFVLDPTLLIEKQKYLDLCSIIPIRKESFLLVYLLDDSQHMTKFIHTVAEKYHLKIKIIKADDGVDVNDSIERWLALFRDATFVITDSFHGTLFSIIFHKNFFSVYNIERGGARFTSILKNLNLENHLISINLPYDVIDCDIDWINVDLKLAHLRSQSLNFLKLNLQIDD